MLALLALFAYERVSDEALVIAAGISDAWLDAGEVGVGGLPTWWGTLSYSLRREGPGALRFELGPGLRIPPAGIEVRPPLPRPLASVEGDGPHADDFDARGVVLRRCPASVLMRF